MLEHGRIRVFIDANVLFSASYKLDSPFRDLWKLKNVKPVISRYVLDEVSRNIKTAAHRLELDVLLTKTGFVSDADHRFLPADVQLEDKDRPILSAAVAASIEYLVTGDRNHFGSLYGTTIASVTILTPVEFLRLHRDRRID